MPDIKGKKINQLDDGKAVVDPLFVLGDQDGKAYNLGAEDLKAKMAGVTANATPLAQGIDLNNVITPGRYSLDSTIFKAGGYINSPFKTKQGIWMPDHALFIVEEYGDNRIIQRIIWPGGKYTEICRTHGVIAYPRNNDTAKWSAWEISIGVIQLLYFQDDRIGGISPDSLSNLNNYDVAGLYEIYTWKVASDGSNSYWGPPKADFLSRGFPDISKYKANAVYNGFIGMSVEYTYSVIISGTNLRQKIYNQYGSSEPWLYSSMPFEFVRDGRILSGSSDFGPWLPYGDKTLRSANIGSIAPLDNTFPAGGASIPPLAFTPGVQVQNPVVKGALNYDGTDFYYTDDAGNKKKITSTIV